MVVDLVDDCGVYVQLCDIGCTRICNCCSTISFYFYDGWGISGYCRHRSVFLDVVVGHRLVGVFHVLSSAECVVHA